MLTAYRMKNCKNVDQPKSASHMPILWRISSGTGDEPDLNCGFEGVRRFSVTPLKDSYVRMIPWFELHLSRRCVCVCGWGRLVPAFGI